MKTFRVIQIATLVLVIGMAATAVALILRESETTTELFDGKTTAGWVIDGDAEVKDGVLVFGGQKNTRVQIADGLRPIFELNLEYRTENKQPIQLEWRGRHFLGHGMHSVPLERLSSKPGEWIEATLKGSE